MLLFFLKRLSIFYYLYVMAKKATRPRDTNQLAKSIVDLATGQPHDPNPTQDGKNPAAVALGKLGGQKREGQRGLRVYPPKEGLK